jgi:hypothetical protein
MGVDFKELLAEDTDTTVSQDEPIFSHIIRGEPGTPRTAQAILMEAWVNGTPVTALCGKVWVPSRDPEKHPLCKKCEEIFEFDRQF